LSANDHLLFDRLVGMAGLNCFSPFLHARGGRMVKHLFSLSKPISARAEGVQDVVSRIQQEWGGLS
jgi:hypothetical protein